MRRSWLGGLAAAVVRMAIAALWAFPALAQNPHFVQGRNYTAATSALTATGKAAGLANSPTDAFLTAETINVHYQCQNSGRNFAPGHPATFDSVVSPVQNIPRAMVRSRSTSRFRHRLRARPRLARTGTGEWRFSASSI